VHWIGLYHEAAKNIGHDELNLILSKGSLDQQVPQRAVIHIGHHVSTIAKEYCYHKKKSPLILN